MCAIVNGRLYYSECHASNNLLDITMAIYWRLWSKAWIHEYMMRMRNWAACNEKKIILFSSEPPSTDQHLPRTSYYTQVEGLNRWNGAVTRRSLMFRGKRAVFFLSVSRSFLARLPTTTTTRSCQLLLRRNSKLANLLCVFSGAKNTNEG